jgi:hypothetical protein
MYLAEVRVAVALARDRVVSQKQGSGKVGKLKNSSRLSHVCSFPIQMATLFARYHFAECPLVLPLRLELS